MDIGEIRKYILSLRPTDWVVEMQRYYEENGCYRVRDLKRLLGDPMKRVDCTRESLMGKLAD